MFKSLLLLTLSFFFSAFLIAQDTTIVQTLTYDSTGRNYIFSFPPDDGTTYEKIIMEYNMRCKGAQVSTGQQPNLGCGEWDYSCNTYIVDSTYTDSLRTFHPTHIISGFSGDEFVYTNSPTNTYVSYDQQEVTYTNTVNETTASIGSGTDLLNHPFGTSGAASKAHYLWTANELISAGLTMGDISSMRLNLNTATADANFLRIKMKHTAQSVLDVSTPDLVGFTEVYFLNTELNVGENEFLFYNNFQWDGTSNILVEMSFTNSGTGMNDLVNGEMTANTMGLVSTGQNYNFEFTGSEYMELPTDGLETISNEITISFWSYGDEDLLPLPTTAFEGVDDQNRRQANIHLPWSNSRIYWDCGNDGNYDRIDKAANPDDFEGKWNHWAFTKNAANGEMKIYLNGTLWHSGTGKTRPIDITSFTLGSSISQSRFYNGNIDEFRIWNVELDETEIANGMFQSIENTHPQYSNLIAYYKMNEGTGWETSNASSYGGQAQIFGNTNWKQVQGADLFNNFNEVQERPNITFVQGEYDLTITEIAVLDTIANNLNAVTTYEVIGTDLNIQSVDYVWQAGFEYLYDPAGTLLDSFPIMEDGTINIGELTYYRKFPSQFEIMSFVTPYGIFLDLGDDGKTWTFDVTDFAPILKNDKRMFLALGGQNQEEMDIKFLFIEGTPPAEVRNIQQIWRSGSSYNFTSIMNDDILEPRDILTDSEGEYFKIRTRVTGHGQEGEFIPRDHWVNINGGDPEFVWEVWTECADNPVYPQGGTWIYDRAGWCPGAPTDLQEWDITNMVTPGQTVNVDYNVTSGSGDSRYITSHQLVTYGAANFNLDAAVVEIQRPSQRVEYDRYNPICNDPIVVLKNTGATHLGTCVFTYQVDGGNPQTYTWTGGLDFMESEEVVLPVSSTSFWAGGGEGLFTVTVSNPNGEADEYAQNNSLTSTYELPNLIDSETVIIALNTNNSGAQNSYRLRDINGAIITSDANFANNTYYRDTVQLADGCYTLELDDSGNNGLEFWAQPAEGEGAFYIRNFAGVIKVFEPDFGSIIRYSFVVGDITNLETPEFDYSFDIFPNPTSGAFELRLDMVESQDIEILVYDLTGRLIHSTKRENFTYGTIPLDLSAYPDGMYQVGLVTKGEVVTKKVVKGK